MSGLSKAIAHHDIYDGHGRRKYLNPLERSQFQKIAGDLPPPQRCFCLVFFYTGLRISEALELAAERIDLLEEVIVIRTLKRRRSDVYRSIPVPKWFLRDLRALSQTSPADRLWSFSRKTGYRVIKSAMMEAGISGSHACPKGLRHGFGIACVQANIPLPTIAKWMGHTSIQTTAIYLNAVGFEERQLAKRIWK
jgi:integrase